MAAGIRWRWNSGVRREVLVRVHSRGHLLVIEAPDAEMVRRAIIDRGHSTDQVRISIATGRRTALADPARPDEAETFGNRSHVAGARWQLCHPCLRARFATATAGRLRPDVEGGQHEPAAG